MQKLAVTAFCLSLITFCVHAQQPPAHPKPAVHCTTEDCEFDRVFAMMDLLHSMIEGQDNHIHALENKVTDLQSQVAELKEELQMVEAR